MNIGNAYSVDIFY